MRHLQQMQGVAGGATQRRALRFFHQFQPFQGGASAGGNQQGSQLARPFHRRPETDKGAKGKSGKTLDPKRRLRKRRRPCRQQRPHQLPAFRRVQHMQGFALGPGGFGENGCSGTADKSGWPQTGCVPGWPPARFFSVKGNRRRSRTDLIRPGFTLARSNLSV